MNTQPHPDAEARSLPELSDERIEAIERTVFSEIARDRTVRRRRRTTGWAIGGAAVAVIVVAAVIAPSVNGVIVGTSTSDAVVEGSSIDMSSEAGSSATDGVALDGAALEGGGIEGAADAARGAVDSTQRDIITTASASVIVTDIPAAVGSLTDAAEARGGYVESMSVGSSGQVEPLTYDTYPSTLDGAWVTVRVPSEELQPLVDELSGLGEVTASSISRQDVTEITLDLQARTDAAQESVDRLRELMAQAGNLSDLLAAESALAERQATLESYQQQLKYYDEQVSLSTLTVSLSEPAETVEADPAGFGDGLAAGWNGLVATLNGIVIALGFLIPWIAVAAVAALVVWGVIGLIRRARTRRSRRDDGTLLSAGREPRDHAESDRSADQLGEDEAGDR